MSDNVSKKLFILTALILLVIGGVLYFIFSQKLYPKVKGLEYLNLELITDTARVKAGVEVKNRIPIPIQIDSIHYSIKGEKDSLGWGQLTTYHTLPPWGDKVLDMKLLLDFERYRELLKKQQGKDSIQLSVDMKAYFDLPLLDQKSISVNRSITAPVSKSPTLKVQQVQVKDFSVEQGYSLLLSVSTENKNLPNLEIQDLDYQINIGKDLSIRGKIDKTMSVSKGDATLEIPIQLETHEAIALLKKKLSGSEDWNYLAKLNAHIESDNPIFDSFDLAIEKDGTLETGRMGSNKNYMPALSQLKSLKVNSAEQITHILADVSIKNPSPIPFYVDSASYFIRYQGKIIASGKRDFEKTLPATGEQDLKISLRVNEQAYQKMMKQAQGKKTIPLEIGVNLLYNLPGAQRQKIPISRTIQAPVPGQSSMKIAGLEVRELDPLKGAYLGLKLDIGSTSLPDLQITQLDYTLQLADDIKLNGNLKDPIKIKDANEVIEIPIHLDADDVNKLVKKAIEGQTNWEYQLQANAKIKSSHPILGPTAVKLNFDGTFEMAKGMGSKKLMPQITKYDTLSVTIQYDTAWVKLDVHVYNPLTVNLHIEELDLSMLQSQEIIAELKQKINKTLPASSSQTERLVLAVNYGKWREQLKQHPDDSMQLEQQVHLRYKIGDLSTQQASFTNTFKIPTTETPVTKLKKTKITGFSLTKGLRLDGIVQVRNKNVNGLKVISPSYDACAAGILDVCGSINRTYTIPIGMSTVTVPMHVSVLEALRVIWFRLTSGKKEKKLYLQAEAHINAANPKIDSTFVRFEKWEKTMLFQNKKNRLKSEQPQ